MNANGKGVMLGFLIPALFGIALGLAMASDAKSAPSSPRLTVVGNKGVCDLSTGKSFQFVGKNFTPGGDVMIIIRYPLNGAKNGEFYSYHTNYGVYRANASGTIRSKLWDCTDGPGGTTDPAGVYPVTAIDFATNRTAPKLSFRVING